MTEAHAKFRPMMSRLLSLRVVIPLLIVLGVLVLLAYVFQQQVRTEHAAVYAQYKAAQMDTTLRLQASIERDIRAGMGDRLHLNFSQLGLNPEVRIALLLDQKDKVMDSARLDFIGMHIAQLTERFPQHSCVAERPPGKSGKVAIRQVVDALTHTIMITAPVRMDEPGSPLAEFKYGRLCIVTDVTLPLAQRSAAIQTVLVDLLLGFGVFALLVGFALHRIVTRRVAKLLCGAQRVAKGDLNAVSHVGGRDEIGQLGTAFDGMVRSMEVSSAQIRKLSQVVEQSPNSIIITDAEGVIEYVNRHFTVATGYAAAEVVGRSMRIHQSEQTPPQVYDELWSTIKSGKTWRGELLNKSKLGALYWEEVCISPLLDAQGNISHFFSEQTNISKRKQAELELRKSEGLFRSIMDNTNLVIFLKDLDGRYLYINQQFEKLFHVSLASMRGKTDHDVFPPDVADALVKNDKAALQSGQLLEIEEMVPGDDGIHAYISGKFPICNDAGETYALCGIATDITARKQAEEDINNLAFFDPLTRLPNRRLLMDRLNSALLLSSRSKLYGALLFLDMDKFKVLNDTLGHDYGDLLLIEVASRIRSCVREIDTVARLGGDEFVVLLEEIDANAELASQKTAMVAEKVRTALSEPYKLREHLQYGSPSIGVAMYLGNEKSVELLLKYADIAMYQAKDAGRNAVRFFDPAMQRAVANRAELEADLRHAIPGGQLQLYYQIQMDSELRPLGAEALIRWIHPTRGMVSPMQFIPIAEESRLILDIGGWVLDTACHQLALWAKDELTRDLTIAVNVSGQQFKQPDFVERVAQTLRMHQIDASGLKLELTESVVLSDVKDVVTKMHALKALGVALSMDDFGTGYSSLSHLKQLPLDQLKIDQSFVRDMLTDPNDAVMVRTIIDMAHNFRLNIIAEGVETEAQMNSLRGMGCTAYQGYHFSRPVPIGELDALLRKD